MSAEVSHTPTGIPTIMSGSRINLNSNSQPGSKLATPAGSNLALHALGGHATGPLTAGTNARVVRDETISKFLREHRSSNEHRLTLQARVKDFNQEAANIREASLLEARNLYNTQLVQQRLNDGWQRDLSTALLQSEQTKVRLSVLMDKNLRLRQKMIQQEEAREREVSFRAKMRQKRDAFQTLIKELEVRQVQERLDLVVSQRRIAKNLTLVQELEMRGMDEVARRRRANENEIYAQQLRMRQQKEGEQLRELQLIKIKHMTEMLNRDIEDQTSLENLLAEQREREQSLEVMHLLETQSAQTDVDNTQAGIKANHLRERQKQQRTLLQSQQRRMAAILLKQQRHSARLRERTMLAEDALLSSSVDAEGEGSDDNSSEGWSEATGSEPGTDGDQDGFLPGEDPAHGQPPSGGHAADGPARRKKTEVNAVDLLDTQEAEIIEQLEKGRERIKMLNRQQRENASSTRQQQKDQLRMLQTEQKRKLGDLIRDQEEELRQIKTDHAAEMEEMMSALTRADIVESQKRQMNKKFDTDSSNGLLGQMLPQYVTDELKAGKMPEPKSFDCVSLAFIDICGFKQIANTSGTGKKIVRLLDSLYKCFDSILAAYPTLYKVETVLDTYMIASGLLNTKDGEPTAEDHAQYARDLLNFSMDAMDAVREIDTSEIHLETLPLRIGLNSGPVMAGVVGNKMIRFCLFGDTVNVASRMCSTGTAFKVQTSPSFRALLVDDPSYVFVERGVIPIKGKGDMATFTVDFQQSDESEDEGAGTPVKGGSTMRLNESS
ncbi:hypothetical protein H9P43_007205 [Blastocladiella emersonii ATCC 22665]|nr:hypothetical protein H9P43_007205 [Blastocladiella emersonii ATCC 22665]